MGLHLSFGLGPIRSSGGGRRRRRTRTVTRTVRVVDRSAVRAEAARADANAAEAEKLGVKIAIRREETQNLLTGRKAAEWLINHYYDGLASKENLPDIELLRGPLSRAMGDECPAKFLNERRSMGLDVLEKLHASWRVIHGFEQRVVTGELTAEDKERQARFDATGFMPRFMAARNGVYAAWTLGKLTEQGY